MKYILKHKQFPPKKQSQIRDERLTIIKEYLDGNLRRFLRRNYRYYKYQLVFSKELKKWVEDIETNKVVEYLKKSYKYPNHISEVINTMKTLKRYYNRGISLSTMHLSIAIIDLLEDDIYNYSLKRYNRGFDNGLKFKALCTKEEAIKEQKARGFIHINLFEEYNKNYSHLFSNVLSDYVYPLNLPHNFVDYRDDIPNDYIALNLIGVEGYTRIEIPRIVK